MLLIKVFTKSDVRAKNKERQELLEPGRVDYAIKKITDLGIEVRPIDEGRELQFTYKGHLVKFWPYTGWHTGKSVKDGRGIKNLLKQLI